MNQKLYILLLKKGDKYPAAFAGTSRDDVIREAALAVMVSRGADGGELPGPLADHAARVAFLREVLVRSGLHPKLLTGVRDDALNTFVQVRDTSAIPGWVSPATFVAAGGDRCPRCGSTRIECSDDERYTGEVAMTVTCLNCNCAYTINHQLVQYDFLEPGTDPKDVSCAWKPNEQLD